MIFKRKVEQILHLPIKFAKQCLANEQRWSSKEIITSRKSSLLARSFRERGWFRSLRYVWVVYLLPSLHSVSNFHTNASRISPACVNGTFNAHVHFPREMWFNGSIISSETLIGNSRVPTKSHQWMIMDNFYKTNIQFTSKNDLNQSVTNLYYRIMEY